LIDELGEAILVSLRSVTVQLMAPGAHQAVARMGLLPGALLVAACRPSSTHASVDLAPSATDARVVAVAVDDAKRVDGTPIGDRKAPDVSAAVKEDCSASPVGPMKHDRASAIAFLCGGRAKCRAYKWFSLLSAPGAMRAVVSLWIGDDFPPDASFEDAPVIQGEQWLVAALPGARLTRRLLAADSGRPRGVSQHPDTPAGTVEVHGERVKYFLSPFAESNWFKDSAAEFDLNPPALVSESTFNGMRMGGCGVQVTTWNWKSFSGSVTWAREAAQGELLPGEQPTIETDEMSPNLRCLGFDYDFIPDVRIDGAFAGEGWTATALGKCALDVDGSKDHGFVTLGKPASRADASRPRRAFGVDPFRRSAGRCLHRAQRALGQR
jgi:hypothetical protein